MSLEKEEVSLKVGDVVMLNSGGPRMTAMVIDSGWSKAECAWFNEGKLETARFSFASLTRKVK